MSVLRPAILLCLLLACLFGTRAEADPQAASLESFAEEDPQIVFRRALYDFAQGDYGAARARLEALLNPVRLQTEQDLQDARKTLGTLYFLRGEERRAREQFELVLLAKNDAELDVYSTAPPVLRFFDLVRAEVRVKAGEFSRVFAMRKNDFEAPRVIERRQVKHSEFLSYLPFGIGQFQNDQVGFGVLFLSIEVLALAANVFGYIMGAYLGGGDGVITTADLPARTNWMAMQYTGLGAFIATWAIGAAHARMHFQPVVSVDRDITGAGKAQKRTSAGLHFTMAF